MKILKIFLATVSFCLMLCGCKGCEQQKPVDPTPQPTVEPAPTTNPDKPGEVKEEVKQPEAAKPEEVKTEEVNKEEVKEVKAVETAKPEVKTEAAKPEEKK